jgi:hypothetical protein
MKLSSAGLGAVGSDPYLRSHDVMMTAPNEWPIAIFGPGVARIQASSLTPVIDASTVQPGTESSHREVVDRSHLFGEAQTVALQLFHDGGSVTRAPRR